MSDADSLAKLRRAIGQARGTGRVPNRVWEALLKDPEGRVYAALRDLEARATLDAAKWQEQPLVHDLGVIASWIKDNPYPAEHKRRPRLRIRYRPRTNRQHGGDPQYVLGEHESQYRRTREAFFAVAASAEPLVISFRERYLSGRLLCLRDAGRFLMSPVLRWFTADDLAHWGIPCLEHAWRMSPERTEFERLDATDRICISYREEERICPIPQHALEWGITAGELSVARRGRGRIPYHSSLTEGSPIHLLSLVAQHLHEIFRWPIDRAERWVLEGHSYPEVAPIWITDGESRIARGITIEVEEWTPAALVADALNSYRATRKGKQGNKATALEVHRHRLLSEDTLKLCLLAFSRCDDFGSLPPWELLHDEWLRQQEAEASSAVNSAISLSDGDKRRRGRDRAQGKVAETRRRFLKGLSMLQGIAYEAKDYGDV